MKINETRRRSLLKAVSYRLLEITIDSLILSFFVEVHLAIGLAITLEVICFILHYGFERVFNKINYGREIS